MKVLIVVDMQKDFVDGVLGTPEAQAIIPKVCDEIQKRADKDTLVIFTKDTHTEDYMNTLEGKHLPVPHCIKGTPGHGIVGEVLASYVNVFKQYMDPWDVYPAETNPILINKPTFGSIELQNVLYSIADNNYIEEVSLMGVCTGICILSNSLLVKATFPEAEVNVIADCCACVTPESHKTALEAMKLCQINIV